MDWGDFAAGAWAMAWAIFVGWVLSQVYRDWIGGKRREAVREYIAENEKEKADA